MGTRYPWMSPTYVDEFRKIEDKINLKLEGSSTNSNVNMIVDFREIWKSNFECKCLRSD